MTTVEAAGWLDRLGQGTARAGANSLHAVRASLAGVAGGGPGTAVANVVKQLHGVRGRLTAVARQVPAARVAPAGPACPGALAWAAQCCDQRPGAGCHCGPCSQSCGQSEIYFR